MNTIIIANEKGVVNLKINGFLIVAVFLLAIFTIGAAGAAENITQDDAVASDTNLGEDPLGESYQGDDFYIDIMEDYIQDKGDWQSKEIAYISSYSQKNGTFKVYVNDTEKQSYDITNGSFGIEDDGYGGKYSRHYQNIYPNDLGIADCGRYAIKVKFNDISLIESSVSVNEREDFDIWLQNPYYCEEDCWSSPSFIAIDSNHLNSGSLEIYVNGTLKVNFTVTGGNFTEIADCSNRSRYLSPADLLSGYGAYRILINFTENGASRTLRDETVVVAKFEPTTEPKLEAYLDLDTVNLPADNIAHIYLPREATGTLTVSYNDVKDKIVSYSKGYGEHYINSWDLNHLGENIITFRYIGDDFGTLETVVKCTVVPSITSPSYVSTGERFRISILTHNWANGKFNIYGYSTGRLLASGTISGGVSTVEMSSNVLGLNRLYLEFAYPGGYYPVIQEVYVVKNSDNIRVSVPVEVRIGDDVTVNITAPATPFNFAYISLDGADYQFYSMENGSVAETFKGLSRGYHTVSVQYNDGYYSNGKLLGDVYSNTFTVSVGLKTAISAPQVNTVYNVLGNLVATLKDSKGNPLSGKTVTIALNGATYIKTTDRNGQVILQVNLPVKTYVANINFKGDSTYLESGCSVKIVVAKATPKLTAKAKKFKASKKTKKLTATLKDNRGRAMKKITLTLKVKSKTFKAKTNSKGKATFKIKKLSKKGTYKAKITFKANSNYNKATRTVKIKVK